MAVEPDLGRRRIVVGQDRDESLEGVEGRLLSGHLHVLADEARVLLGGRTTVAPLLAPDASRRL